MVDSSKASLAGVTAAVSGDAVPRIHRADIVVSLTPPSARRADVSLGAVTTPYFGLGVPKVHQAYVVVVYSTDIPEKFNQRAWTFNLDGHTFYVLTLGEMGTFVYDLTTNRWSEWKTEGIPVWNMEIGTTWDNRIIAGDIQNPTIWELDTMSFLDDGFKPMTRIVTGGVPSRQSGVIPNYSASLAASVGDPSSDDATVTMEFSDDLGNTWSTPYISNLAAGKFNQLLTWRSLGVVRQPGRIFRITDTGGLVRIDGMDADIGD